jgi:hypothetical protein
LGYPLGVNLLWVLARAGVTIAVSTAEVGKGLDDYIPTLFGASAALHQSSSATTEKQKTAPAEDHPLQD